jgi:predicted MFS family arabinose efflux permease
VSATTAAASSDTGALTRAERQLLARILPARLLINAQFRIVYPFLPAIARGLGVTLETAALLVAFRAAFGAISPLFGFLADRVGRKPLMVGGIVALTAGAALVAMSQTFGLALVAFGLLGLAQSAYDPSMQAHVGDVVPIERRGRAMGIVELSWSGSWLIGVPIAGFLMARYGWQAPFAVIALLGLVCAVITANIHEARRRHATDEGAAPEARSFWAALHFSRPVVFTLAASALILLANESLFLVYGALMEDRYNLALGALGVASIVVALAEFAGASAVVAFVDRIGKRKALLFGLAFNAIFFLVLPLTLRALPVALAGLAAVALTSEFSIVTSIPLLSGLAERSGGLVMSIRTALMWGMVIIASLVAPRLWDAFGFWAVALGSALIAAAAALLIWRGVPRASASGIAN